MSSLTQDQLDALKLKFERAETGEEHAEPCRQEQLILHGRTLYEPQPHSFQTAAPSQGSTAAADSLQPIATAAATSSRREPFTAPGDPIQLAVAKAIRELLALQIPRVRGCMDAVDFRNRVDLLKRVAAIVDPVLFEIGSGGAENSHEIYRDDWRGILAEALNDRCLISQFVSAEERWNEENSQFGVGG